MGMSIGKNMYDDPRFVTAAMNCCQQIYSHIMLLHCSWDIHSRRCVERFSNNDGTITASLAAASKHLAVGAESGVVNLYSEHKMSSSKNPLKSIMNLHTSAEDLRFNHDGQILAMLTKREQHGLKLLHVPSKTVFSNWPTSKTPLKHAFSMDFSPESKFFCIGNDKGKCLLYQLGHYQD
jgi:U3 small nucleolar RNA-associated protein 18